MGTPKGVAPKRPPAGAAPGVESVVPTIPPWDGAAGAPMGKAVAGAAAAKTGEVVRTGSNGEGVAGAGVPQAREAAEADGTSEGTAIT